MKDLSLAFVIYIYLIIVLSNVFLDLLAKICFLIVLFLAFKRLNLDVRFWKKIYCLRMLLDSTPNTVHKFRQSYGRFMFNSD